MGILLDSTVLVAAERSGRSPARVIADTLAAWGDTEATLSVVTLAELAHGIERADTLARRVMRERFLDELLQQISTESITPAIAMRAGRIDARLRITGVTIPLGDLLIGATALQLGYGVVTHNVRHFRLVHDLDVREI